MYTIEVSSHSLAIHVEGPEHRRYKRKEKGNRKHLIQTSETCGATHASTRASIQSGMHERAFRPYWFDTFEWSEYLMQYSTSCTNYVAIQKRRARHDGSRFHGRVWSAPGSFGEHEKFSTLRLSKVLTFKATKVDGDTSEQPQNCKHQRDYRVQGVSQRDAEIRETAPVTTLQQKVFSVS